MLPLGRVSRPFAAIPRTALAGIRLPTLPPQLFSTPAPNPSKMVPGKSKLAPTQHAVLREKFKKRKE